MPIAVRNAGEKTPSKVAVSPGTPFALRPARPLALNVGGSMSSQCMFVTKRLFWKSRAGEQSTTSPKAAPTLPLSDSTGSVTVARTVNSVAAVSVAGSEGSIETRLSGSPRIATESIRRPASL